MASGGIRALVVRRPGGVETLELAVLPRRELGPQDVRIQVESAGINPVDAANRADPTWARIEAPYVVGYECSGVIVETGSLVDDLRQGDAVWVLLPVRGTRWGTYADELVVDASLVSPRPESLTAIEAAAVPFAGATALQLLDRLDPQPGEWVLVHGPAGGVGHLLVQLARTRGARVAGVSSPARHELLRSLGVEIVVDRFDDEAIRRAHEEAGADFPVVADLVGSRLAASLPFMAEGGRAGTIVDLTGDFEEAIDRNVTLHGVLVRPGRSVLRRLADLVHDGRLVPVIDEALSFDDRERAHRRIESGSGQGKLVFSVAS
jgi:NADPH:quinone reductase-like Zn-dependent oxidoreductase